MEIILGHENGSSSRDAPCAEHTGYPIITAAFHRDGAERSPIFGANLIVALGLAGKGRGVDLFWI